MYQLLQNQFYPLSYLKTYFINEKLKKYFLKQNKSDPSLGVSLIYNVL